MALSAVLALGACGKSDEFTFNHGDTLTVTADNLEDSITASGQVVAKQEVTLTATLNGPISHLDAKVGQRVQAGQHLATIDVSATQRDLEAQKAANAAQEVGTLNQVEAGNQQLSYLREQLNRGLHPGINGAQAGLRQAQDAFDAAQAETNFGGDEEITQARAALEQARAEVDRANSAALQSGITTLNSTATPGVDPSTYAVSLLQWSDSQQGVHKAWEGVEKAEAALHRAILRQDKAAADKERAAQAAWANLADAKRNLEAAELAANQEVNTLAKSVQDTLEQAAATRVSEESAQRRLELEMGNAEIHSPISGLITSVEAKQGQAATGTIATIADDSQKLIKVLVRESDLHKVQLGNDVIFTSETAPGKEFNGKVEFISPVAAAPPKQDQFQSAPTKTEFSVDILVTGPSEELRLGSSAKAKIITSRAENALTVPHSAIYDQDGKSYVLIVDKGVITQREITKGQTTEFYVEVATGIEPGNEVIVQADAHRHNIGQKVTVAPQPGSFEGEQ
ncbi:efflux RND transporter periplasmic adaptor subunit [Corynebacterium phocae]|nr:efflux RND transporter periplasmic adaptor subunit [Corynebacterium phocae]